MSKAANAFWLVVLCVAGYSTIVAPVLTEGAWSPESPMLLIKLAWLGGVVLASIAASMLVGKNSPRTLANAAR